MKQYYLHNGQNQIGPFSVEELKERNINADTYVWKEGMGEWQKANEVAELSGAFGVVPPPFKASIPAAISAPYPSQSSAYKKGKWIGRNPLIALIILALIVFIGYLIVKSNHSENRNFIIDRNDTVKNDHSPKEIKQELGEKERENPLDYLTSKITMRENLIGQKVFEGTITSNASISTFKDIKIKLSYVSQTGTVISEEQFVIYETIKPNSSISIGKIKTVVPGATKNFTISIVSALPN